MGGLEAAEDVAGWNGIDGLMDASNCSGLEGFPSTV